MTDTRLGDTDFLDDGGDDLTERKDLVMACRILENADVYDEQGHFSARTGGDRDSIWINELKSPGKAGIENFVKLDIYDQDTWPDTIPIEIVLHTEIYKQRDDVNAICHNHSPYSIVVGNAGIEIRPIHPIGYVQPTPITVFDDYLVEGGMLVVSEEEGKMVADALGDDRAIHLRGHGNNVVGRSIIEAVVASIRLEYSAMLLYRIASIGEPWYMPEELAAEHEKFAYSTGGMKKSLDYHLTFFDVD